MDYTTLMRKKRGLSQKIYLIETIQPKTKLIREFVVMGSTGNVYTVTIKNIPVCTCPDNTTRKKICKHIFFVLVKIMNCFNPDLGNYTDTQLEIMFNSIPIITNLLCVDQNVKNKYNELKESNNKKITQKNTDDDCCPVCLEDLNNGEDLTFCKVKCGKNIHTNCFNMVNSKKSVITCMFCQSNWNEEKYINLNVN